METQPFVDDEDSFDQSDGPLHRGHGQAMIDDTAVDLEMLTVNSQFLSPDSCHSQEVIQQGSMDVSVKKTNIARSNSAVKAGMPCYQMTSKPRGQALIIEIDKYENDVLETRIGSQYDVKNLQKLFSGLGFEVEVKQNLIKTEFDREVRNFAQKKEHLTGHMMIMAVLSHGRDGNIYTADGRVISTETIYEKFNNQYCPFLKGKPKFFIIQACRGDDVDKGAGNDPLFWEDQSLSASSRKRNRMYGTDTDANPFKNCGEVNKARPTWEDMIIAYSTIPGFASIRDHDKGTWFIQSLVEVFSNHAHDKELIDLLRMTSERLSQFTNDHNEKQTCNVEMRHLYKRIYFNPGYFVEEANDVKDDATSSPRLRRSVTSPRALRRSRSNPPNSPRRTSSLYEDDD